MWNIEVYLVYFLALATGWSPALGEENQLMNKIREPRHSQHKLCRKYGICGGYGNQGYQGYNGGYNQGGYQGGYNQGGYYGGYNQGGYQGGYEGRPPVNIAISQSQSLSNFGGGGFGSPAYPNNYNGGYNNYNGYPGANRPGYFENSYGSYNNQYNGGYQVGAGGYGFQRPFGFGNDYSDEDSNEDFERSAKAKDSTD